MGKSIKTGIATAAMCLALASCHEYDFTPISDGEAAYQNYENAFIQKFGEPAPDQTWGFGNAASGMKKGITRSANTNANEWAKDWDVPAVLTEAQKDIVRQYFQQNNNPEGIAINYTDFFVQDVYKGGTNLKDALTTEKYREANGTMITGSDKMNKLTAGSGEDHINNYNNAQCSVNNEVWDGTLKNANDPNSKNYHSDKIMLMVNSKTDCFGYHCSENNVQYNDRYVIIPGDAIMTWARNNNKQLNDADVSGMYFVGFDFEMLPTQNTLANTNQWLGTEVEKGTEGAIEVNGKWYIAGGADGYYSDWIIRVKPGKETLLRIIAEDLPASVGDFDFNDVVFDVQLNWPETGKHTITLQAAGGTLPLYIGEPTEEHEVHKLFGVETGKMVNTEEWTEHKAPVTFVIEGNYTNANEIPVRVKKGNDLPLLTAETGKVPSKLAVPVTYKWCKELKDIETVYPKLKDYVSNPDIIWYEPTPTENVYNK